MADDPHQLRTLIADPAQAATLRQLRDVMQQWRDQTADSVSANPSLDGFDRKTGERLFRGQDTSYYRSPAGADREAHRVNRPGPR